MAETDEETERYNDKTCIFPGCDRPAADSEDRGYGESYKPRYCDLEEHNAVNMHQELKKQEEAEA
ncbi:MAG: hypothetical protein M3401_11755 [Actinomycetota bacterium]|nr:hypothetical protein [Actinomycetota bacterium]